MFNIFNRIRKLEADSEVFRKQISQLKCEHDKEYRIFKEADDIYFEGIGYIPQSRYKNPMYGYETCHRCGKILAYFKTESEYRAARIEYMKWRISMENQKIMELEPKGETNEPK